jgi:hypothetical protein
MSLQGQDDLQRRKASMISVGYAPDMSDMPCFMKLREMEKNSYLQGRLDTINEILKYIEATQDKHILKRLEVSQEDKIPSSFKVLLVEPALVKDLEGLILWGYEEIG